MLLQTESMSRYATSLPVVLDEPGLCCDMCARALSSFGLIGVEVLPMMWSASSPCTRTYTQTLLSRTVCLDCFGFQSWVATLAHMVYFTYRRQILLRAKGAHFMTTWNEARSVYEDGATAHQQHWTKRHRARRARLVQANEPLRIRLLRSKLATDDEKRRDKLLE